MSFLDDVDSLKAKAGISKIRLPLVLGLGLVVLALVAFCGFTFWTGFSAPSGEITHELQSEASEENNEEASTQESSIYVHIAGAVKNPGMYELPNGARVSDAVEAAGGFNEDAQESSINLARTLNDGEQVLVASNNDIAMSPSSETQASESYSPTTGKVNINTASAEELMTLDGVGEATAEKIITYREEQGPFASIEEIKEVSGIGDKKYEAIKDVITV